MNTKIMSLLRKVSLIGLSILALGVVGVQYAYAAPYDLLVNVKDTSNVTQPLVLSPDSVEDGVSYLTGFRGVNGVGEYRFFNLGSGIGTSGTTLFVTPNSIEWDGSSSLRTVVDGKASTSSVAALAATVGSLGTPFAMESFMLQEATSTTQYVATATTTGFMTASMVNKLASLNVVSTSTPTINSTNRTLNSCFQVSTTKDALVSYSVDVDSTVSLSGGAVGQVALTTYTDSGCTTNTTVVSKGKAGLTGTLVVGLTLNNPSTLTLGGVVTRGLYAKLVTTNVTGTPTFTMNTTQEVTGNLTQ